MLENDIISERRHPKGSQPNSITDLTEIQISVGEPNLSLESHSGEKQISSDEK